MQIENDLYKMVRRPEAHPYELDAGDSRPGFIDEITGGLCLTIDSNELI